MQEVSSFPAEALACSLHLIPALNGVCPVCFYPFFLKRFRPACRGSQQTPPPNSCLLLQPTSLASTSSIPFSGYPAGCPPRHHPAPPLLSLSHLISEPPADKPSEMVLSSPGTLTGVWGGLRAISSTLSAPLLRGLLCSLAGDLVFLTLLTLYKLMTLKVLFLAAFLWSSRARDWTTSWTFQCPPPQT